MTVETTEYAGMMRRMIAAHGRRVADADPFDLAELAELHEAVSAAERVAVAGLRRTGFSWGEIGDALGMTRQSAWVKFRGSEDAGAGPA